jgi:hypothetical protein
VGDVGVEAAQDRLGGGGAEPDGGGVLQHQVVILLDQLPVKTREIASDAAFNRSG